MDEYRYIGPYRCNAFALHAHGDVEHGHDGGAFEHTHPDEVIPDPKPMAITVMVSKDERDHIDMLRRQSYELSVERGHMRRG